MSNEDFPKEFENLVVGERYSFFLDDCCVQVQVIDATFLGRDVEGDEIVRYRFDHVNVLRAYNSTLSGLVLIKFIL